MQNKKLILTLGVIVIIVGVAAFLAGRMLNGQISPLGLFGLGGKGMMSVSVKMEPAKDLPTTQPEITGLFVERKDNSIVVSSVSMKGGGGGVVVQVGSGDAGPSVSGGPSSDGPKVEVVVTGDTIIYLDTTQPPSAPPTSGKEVTVQQTVGKGSLDDLKTQSFVTVWGRKSGDRIIAETILISNPVIFKRP